MSSPHALPCFRLVVRLQLTVHTCYIQLMTTIEDIERAIEQLSPRELARFRTWYEAFEAARFDETIARDSATGKLDAIAEEALAAHRAGGSREL